MAKARKSKRARPALARSLSEQLLAAIEGRGLSCYALAKLADIDPTQLARFISGQRDIKLGTADRIAEALGLDLMKRGQGRGRPSPVRAVAAPTNATPEPDFDLGSQENTPPRSGQDQDGAEVTQGIGES